MSDKPFNKNRFLMKTLFWIVVVLAGSWYLQELGPIEVNGVSLSAPLSDKPLPDKP